MGYPVRLPWIPWHHGPRQRPCADELQLLVDDPHALALADRVVDIASLCMTPPARPAAPKQSRPRHAAN